MTNASLSLALALCASCASLVDTRASFDRLPDLHARALALAAVALVGSTQADLARVARVAHRVLLDGPGALDPSSTVSEEELQAWQHAVDLLAPEASLSVVTTQAWPALASAGAFAAARGGPAAHP